MFLKKEAILFLFLTYSVVFCDIDSSDNDSDDNDDGVDKCLVKDHNSLVNAKCLGVAALLTKLFANEFESPEEFQSFEKHICKGVEVVKICIEGEGGYCDYQDQFGPTVVKVLDALCSDDEEFDLLTSVEESLDKEYDDFSQYYNRCVMEELGIDIDEDDENFQKVVVPTVEKDAIAGYKCFVKSVENFKPSLLDKAQHFARIYYKVLGFDV